LKDNPVKRELARGGIAVGAFLAEFATRGIARILAAAGAEFVIYDQEHTGWSVETLAPLLDSSHAAGIVPLVRVPATERHLIAAVLDAGAMGVMVPMVESAEQARAIVSAAKYPPEGRRGVGPMYPDEMDADLPTTLIRMNREQLVLAMVETAAGVEHVDEIAAVDGIDLLWIGHGDLTTSLGIPGRFGDERYLDAAERILTAARARGKPVGMMAVSPEDGRQLVERGFRCIGFADRALYGGALREAHAAVREAADSS
jgi:2-dehydro-3-deoxyglucarate aldolase/4-hydroxy-2-oxoheptanedioate aldolase